jgi:hypothetical protein
MLRKLFSANLIASLLVVLTLFSPQVIHAQGCGSILFNSGFDEGTNGWIFGGGILFPPYNGITQLTSDSYQGSSAALLQPKSNQMSVIYRTVFIPFGASSGQITFFLKTTSSAPPDQLDLLRVSITNSVGAFLPGLVATYSSSSPASYQSQTVYLNNVSQYAGQRLILQFVASPHSSNTTGRTTFKVDNVCLNFY